MSKTPHTVSALVLPFLLAVGLLVGTVQSSAAAEHLVGGYSEVPTTNEQVIAAAQFAATTQSISTESGPEITILEILSAQQQVVAGMNYRLRLKVKVDGEVMEAEAVVWRKLDGKHELTSWKWKSDLNLVGSWVKHHTRQEDHVYPGDTNWTLEVTFQANGQFLWQSVHTEGTNTVDESITGNYSVNRGMMTFLFDEPSTAARKRLPEWFAIWPSELKGQQSFRFQNGFLVLEHDGSKLRFYMSRKADPTPGNEAAWVQAHLRADPVAIAKHHIATHQAELTAPLSLGEYNPTYTTVGQTNGSHVVRLGYGSLAYDSLWLFTVTVDGKGKVLDVRKEFTGYR